MTQDRGSEFPWRLTPSNPFGAGRGITRLAHVSGELVESMKDMIDSLDVLLRASGSHSTPQEREEAFKTHSEHLREMRIRHKQMLLAGKALWRYY